MPIKTLKLASIFFFISFIAPKNVHAYLDPGSGSYLIQIIIASIAGFGYLVKANWAKIRNIFFKKNGKEAENENQDKLS